MLKTIIRGSKDKHNVCVRVACKRELRKRGEYETVSDINAELLNLNSYMSKQIEIINGSIVNMNRIHWVATCSKALLVYAFEAQEDAIKQVEEWNKEYLYSQNDCEATPSYMSIKEYEALCDEDVFSSETFDKIIYSKD